MSNNFDLSSPDLLTDFQVKKDIQPLRKQKAKTSLLSDRFENILKRKEIGEFSLKLKNKKNRK